MHLCRIAKPNVISAFADVAMAIEDGFVPYLNVVMQVLHGASGVEITNDTDDDMVEYINTLRESILEAYTGIVQVRGCKGILPVSDLTYVDFN